MSFKEEETPSVPGADAPGPGLGETASIFSKPGKGCVMLFAVGLAVGLMVVALAVRYELRSALYETSLSNGVEVLVNQETYGSIVRRFQTLTEPDDLVRWDDAVLDTLRPERPREWRFLVQSLPYRVAPTRVVRRRVRRTQAVKR
jgi:hypothetical protein